MTTNPSPVGFFTFMVTVNSSNHVVLDHCLPQWRGFFIITCLVGFLLTVIFFGEVFTSFAGRKLRLEEEEEKKRKRRYSTKDRMIEKEITPSTETRSSVSVKSKSAEYTKRTCSRESRKRPSRTRGLSRSAEKTSRHTAVKHVSGSAMSRKGEKITPSNDPRRHYEAIVP